MRSIVNGNKTTPVQPTAEAEAASQPASKPAASKPAPAVVVEEPVAEGEVTFDFYEMLPNLDVGLGEDEQTATGTSAATAATAAPPAVSKQGIYIIQAGSFSGSRRCQQAQS